MEFEWDDEKYRLNLNKHGVDFVDAILIFENDVLSAVDRRRDYGEVRVRSIGLVDDDCFVVVHTQRGNSLRLISAWKGGADERELFRAYVSGGGTSQT